MCLTMKDPATSWLEIVELPVVDRPTIPTGTKGRKGISTNNTPQVPYFDKSSAMISTLVNKTWFSRYPRCQQVIYDNGSEFKLHFKALCDTYGIKRKPTSVKHPSSECNTGVSASSNHGDAPHCRNRYGRYGRCQ